LQAGDIPGEGVFAHVSKRLEDAIAIPLGDALKLFFG
jgi:hypothetical protein